MEKVERKRKKDDEKRDKRKGKKEVSKSSTSVATVSVPFPESSDVTSADIGLAAGPSIEKDSSTAETSNIAIEEDEKNADKESEGSLRQSPEPNCSICLCKLENKSFTDSCFHTFCFVCLLEWSKVKTECPLCKQPFKSIIHNVRSYDDYDQYDVQKQDPANERRFRYRTTLTFDRLLALQNQHQRDQIQVNQQPVDYNPRPALRRSSRRTQQQQQQQQSQTASVEFRRNIYRNNLRVVKNRHLHGYRNIKPDFLRKNPTAVHRLAPWLNRELNALLRNQENHVTFVMELILDLIKRYSISSEEFYQHICPFVGRNTLHFMHEFENFAKSPLHDMRSYDANTQYMPFTQLVDTSEASSSDDDDVIVLSPRETATATATATTSGNQSSISLSISLGHPSQQIVMTSSSWDPQSEANQSERDGATSQTAVSGWESPQPGPSGIFSSSVTEPSCSVMESTHNKNCQVSSSMKSEPSDQQQQKQVGSSSESSETEANGEDDNVADDSDVVIIGYEKPWAERSPILISDLDDDSTDETAEQSKEKSGSTVSIQPGSSGESHKTSDTADNSRRKERGHSKSCNQKFSSSSSHSNERRHCHGHNLTHTSYSQQISSRSKSRSRSRSRSRHSKSKRSSSYSREMRSQHQCHHEESTASSSSLQLHISQKSIRLPLSCCSNIYRVGYPNCSSQAEHSSSFYDYESYSSEFVSRRRRLGHSTLSPVRQRSHSRSRSSSVEIIACKRRRKGHKKHKKHKHRKHHRSKHSSSKLSSICGSVSDSTFASSLDIIPISPQPISMFKKHSSGHKNSHMKRCQGASPNTDEVRIIATVQGEGSCLSRFPKHHGNTTALSSTAATATCSQLLSNSESGTNFLDELTHNNSTFIAGTIGADVIVPSENTTRDCMEDSTAVLSQGEEENNESDGMSAAISVPVSTHGSLAEINDPDLRLMFSDFCMDKSSSSTAKTTVSEPIVSASPVNLPCASLITNWPSSSSISWPTSKEKKANCSNCNATNCDNCCSFNNQHTSTVDASCLRQLSGNAVDSTSTPISITGNKPPLLSVNDKPSFNSDNHVGNSLKTTTSSTPLSSLLILGDNNMKINSEGSNSKQMTSQISYTNKNYAPNDVISDTSSFPVHSSENGIHLAETTNFNNTSNISNEHGMNVPVLGINTTAISFESDILQNQNQNKSLSSSVSTCNDREHKMSSSPTLGAMTVNDSHKISDVPHPLYQQLNQSPSSIMSSLLSPVSPSSPIPPLPSLPSPTSFCLSQQPLPSTTSPYSLSTAINFSTATDVSSLNTSPSRKAREEAICTDSDLHSMIPDIFACDNAVNDEGRQELSASPLPQYSDKDIYDSDSTCSPPQLSPDDLHGKLLIDIEGENSSKNSEAVKADDNEDSNWSSSGSTSSSSPSSLTAQQTASSPNQMTGKSHLSNSDPSSSYEFSSNLSLNSTSIKLTIKGLPSSSRDHASNESANDITVNVNQCASTLCHSPVYQCGSSNDNSDDSELSNHANSCNTLAENEIQLPSISNTSKRPCRQSLQDDFNDCSSVDSNGSNSTRPSKDHQVVEKNCSFLSNTTEMPECPTQDYLFDHLYSDDLQNHNTKNTDYRVLSADIDKTFSRLSQQNNIFDKIDNQPSDITQTTSRLSHAENHSEKLSTAADLSSEGLDKSQFPPCTQDSTGQSSNSKTYPQDDVSNNISSGDDANTSSCNET